MQVLCRSNHLSIGTDASSRISLFLRSLARKRERVKSTHIYIYFSSIVKYSYVHVSHARFEDISLNHPSLLRLCDTRQEMYYSLARERERERASIRQRRVWSWSSDIYKGAGRCGNSSIIFLVYSRFMSNHNRTGSPRERKSIGQRVTRSPRLGPWDIFKRARLVLLAHHAEPRIGIRVRASVSASFRDSLSLSLSPRRDAIRVH